MRVLLISLAVFSLAALPATAAAEVPEGADWTQEYVTTSDGVELHLDVLRPKGIPEGQKTPVVAIVSPYLGHSGGGTGANPQAEPGPSPRFNDFINGAKLFQKGWSVVLADLRGSGGSSGCLDILGPGEQTDIKTAVEWAAAQPWSTGKVAMYGKSYDGNTGVVGAAIRPKGLAAVVGQQVVGDRYRGSYSNGVRYLQSFAYPSVSYGSGAEAGWTLQDDPQYTTNSVASGPECQAGLVGHYDPSPDTAFWKSRDFVEIGRGSTVPFFMTTGFVDANTNIGAGTIDFFNGLAGPKRLWIGWWDHVRGNDTVGDDLAMGRAGWYDEVMRFLDEHVRGVKPAVKDPVIAVQGSDGRWREEAAWPPADQRALEGPLKAGGYTDDGDNNGSNDAAAGPGGSNAGSSTGVGVWTLSAPLPHVAHVAGFPVVRVNAVGLAQANVAANVYDVAPDGKATMISRGASLLGSEGVVEVPMYPTEWTFESGHRVGVLISGSNSEAWLHQPTNQTVKVDGGTFSMPWLRFKREQTIDGAPAPRLIGFRERAPFPLADGVLPGAEQANLIPPPLTAPPAQPAPPATTSPRPVSSGLGSLSGRRLTIRLRVRGRKLVASGRAPARTRVKLVVKRGRRVIARKTLPRNLGSFSTRIRVRGSLRRLTVVATVRFEGRTLRATARRR